MRLPLLIAALGAALTWCQAPAGAQSVPRRLSAERLKRTDALLERYVDAGKVAGGVVLVLRDGLPAYERAFGWADREAGRKMAPDAIFRIASQSKTITSAAALILVEEGRIGLNEPVSDFIPTFAKTTVATEDGIVPAKRLITIRDLLTHTAGISYGIEPRVAKLYEAKGLGPAAGNGWYTADKDEPICTTMERLGTLPFVAQPREQWVYGYNLDILGCVVERASGMPLDQFIEQRITRPLGMRDTHFFLPPEKRARLTAVYGSGANGKVERAPEGAKGQGHYVDGPRKSFSGGAGLLSTARDFARFLEMVRCGGALDGVRILAPKTVDLMTTDQAGAIRTVEGRGFGFGFEVVERYGAKGMAGVGAFGWGGAYGTTFEVDRATGLVSVIMIQLMPNRSDIRVRLPDVIYQAIID